MPLDDTHSNDVATAVDGPTSTPVAARPGPPESARLKIGRFTVLQLVGAGGMGKVFAAYDPELDRRVAVKLVHRGSEEGQSRLLREAQALAKVSHPNVVAIHDVGTHDGEVFMAMEFVTGLNLRQWLRAAPRRAAEVLERFLQAGEGLQAVHAAGLVHRDVKPDNVIVGADGRVRVVDFGLVGATNQATPSDGGASGDGDDERLTAAGTLMGTPGYMSPEQHDGRSLTAASDLFSFCVALYEGLYGERPFRARGLEQQRAAKLAGAIAPPPAGGQVPAWLRAVVVRGLAAAPEQRWRSMAELLAALRSDPIARRRRRLQFAGWLALAALGGLVAVFAVSAGLAAWRRAEAERLAEAHWTATDQRAAAMRAAGDEAGAAAAFTAFVSAEEHRGTPALPRAWLAEAARARGAGRPAAARAAYASAYSTASDPAGEWAALRGLAEMLFETWSIDQLEVVLAASQRLPGAADPALLPWSIEVATAQRDLARASAALTTYAPLLPDDLAARAPLLRALGEATPTDHTATRVTQLADGRIALTTEAALILADAAPALPAQATLAWPERRTSPPRVFSSRRHGEVWLLDWRELGGEQAELVVRELRDGAMVERDRWTDALPLSAALLDEARGPALYVGIGPFLRHLVEVRRGPDGWLRGPAHPGTDAAISDIAALAAADLDRDGREELIVAAGPWRAYDVRVLRRPADGAPFTLVAREKLGHVAALAPLRSADGTPLIVAAKTEQFANPQQFPSPPHFGAPAGLHLLRLAGGALEPVAVLPLRDAAAGGPAWAVTWLGVGDLDGDGRDDLVTRIRDPDDPLPGLVIDRQLAPGEFARVRLRGATPLALVQVDADPQRELVVELDGKLWVLGAGAATLPRLAAQQPAPLAVQPHADPLLVETQRRAEALVTMGFGPEAAAQLERSAGLASDPGQRAAMLGRAAELYAAAKMIDAAGQAHEQLARVDPAAGLAGAARLYDETGRSAEALARTEALLARDDLTPELRAEATARRDVLAPLVRPTAALTYTFDRPLADAWRVTDPLGLRRDAARGALQVDAFSDSGELASVPVAWDGGPLSLTVELTTERLEWGAGLAIGLHPEGSDRPTPALGVGVEAVGGRASLAHRVQCFHPDHARPQTVFELASVDASTPLRGTVRLELHADRLICAWIPSVGEAVRKSFPLRERPAAGRHRLVLSPAMHGGEAREWAEVWVRRIEVGQVRLAEAPASPLERAARLHAEGDLAGAVAAYAKIRRPPPRLHVWRSAALLERGEPRAAEAALDLALARDDLEVDGALGKLLRLRAPLIGPALRARAPERYALQTLTMWHTAMSMNPDAVTLRGLDWLASDLETAATAETPASARAHLWILTQRGRAWSRCGEHARARRDLLAGLAAAPLFTPAERDRNEYETAIVSAHVELAVIAAVSGSVPDACAHAAKALAHARAPEIVADELWTRAELRALHDAPAWRAVLGR